MNSMNQQVEFQFTNVFSNAFSLAGRRYGKLLLAILAVWFVPFLISLGPMGLAFFLSGGKNVESNPLTHGALAIFWATWFVVLSAWTKACLIAARGENFEFRTLWVGAMKALKVAGALILVLIAAGVASIFLLIPGIFVGIKLQMAPFYVIDQDMNPIEAFQASWRDSAGHWWVMFGLDAVFGIMAWLAGLTVIGSVLITPVVGVAMALIYIAATGRSATHSA